MSTTETQAGSDIVERKHQGDICDPWIYFRVAVAADRNEWFAIKNKLDQEPYGVHIDGKIYVLGGFAPDYPFQVSTIVPEVFDTRRVKEGWRELKDTEDAPVLVNGHAVLDGGKRIFVFGHMNELNVFIVTMIDGRCIIRISEKIGGHLPLMTGFCISWTRA
ncbi:hypothetical protein RHGRI_029131 [Rhododendron griersonianum]|uniref:Uncharacterized protein n=1 Tax=Rhododendron griersonianum TaxID=479676 RepID=A0AAV6IK81_9ERIC|nr:hypothetical protein RHGRI_029131 [Rhododendron griersonianum]